MIRASIAYSNAGHARIQALCKRHDITVIELFESMAFADDQAVNAAIAQGLPRRKAAMLENKKSVSAARQVLKTMTPEEIAMIIGSRTVKA